MPSSSCQLLAAVRAAIDARRLGASELRAHEAECRRGQSRLDALPALSAIDAAEQPVAVGPGQQRVAGRVQRRDAMAVQPKGLEPSIAEPEHSVSLCPSTRRPLLRHAGTPDLEQVGDVRALQRHAIRKRACRGPRMRLERRGCWSTRSSSPRTARAERSPLSASGAAGPAPWHGYERPAHAPWAEWYTRGLPRLRRSRRPLCARVSVTLS